MTEIPARLSWARWTWAFSARSTGRWAGRSCRAVTRTWTRFHLGGVLLALFPLRDLTAEAAPGGRVANEISWERLR
jgi:hypothetical protein